MEAQTLLALYRTRLAEQRSAISLLQFGMLLVTLPLTIHAGLSILGQQHAGAARVHILLPLWLVLTLLLVTGIAVSAWATHALIRASKSCRALRGQIDAELPDSVRR